MALPFLKPVISKTRDQLFSIDLGGRTTKAACLQRRDNGYSLSQFALLDAPIYEKNWSFPSGHAAFFFALSTAVYFYNKKWGVFFFIASSLLSIGRIMGGVHYPSDILGGAIIGVLCAYLVRRYILKN